MGLDVNQSSYFLNEYNGRLLEYLRKYAIDKCVVNSVSQMEANDRYRLQKHVRFYKELIRVIFEFSKAWFDFSNCNTAKMEDRKWKIEFSTFQVAFMLPFTRLSLRWLLSYNFVEFCCFFLKFGTTGSIFFKKTPNLYWDLW